MQNGAQKTKTKIEPHEPDETGVNQGFPWVNIR